MYSILLTDPDSTDDFVVYKAPYLASCCCAILPSDILDDLFQEDSILDSIFRILFNRSMSCLFTLYGWLKYRREGLFQTVIESFVRIIPTVMFQYLSRHADFVQKNIAIHLNDMVVLNIGRFLLDIPLDCRSYVTLMIISKSSLVGRL